MVFNTTIPPGVAASSSSSTKPASARRRPALVCLLRRERAQHHAGHEIEGLASCLDYFKAMNDPFGNKLQAEYDKLYRAPSYRGQRRDRHVPRIKLWEAAVKESKAERESVAKALDHAKIEQARGGGRNGPRHTTREDEHVHRCREERQVRDRREEQRPRRSRGVLERGAG